MDASPPRRVRRKEARPGELIAAALDLFVERGFAATRLEDVASRAGVTKGTLYLYFDSKEALFKAVIEQGIVPVIDEAEKMAAGHAGSAAELLTRLMQGWWENVGATRLGGIPKLVMAEAQNFPDVARYYNDRVIARAHALLGSVLAAGIAAGEFRPVDPDYAFRVVFAPLFMMMIWQHSFGVSCGGGVDPATFIETSIDMALNGLRKRMDPV